MNAPMGFSAIESLNTKNISEQDLNKILEVERDMWAREDGLGEYVKCNNCTSILSKEDIFGELSKEIQNETVTKIENILCLDSIICPNCQSTQTEFIFGDEYVDEIIDRFKNSESYLSVYKDKNGVIRGFVDGYIDDFSKIYNREFKKYYKCIGEVKISQLIEETIKTPLPNKLFYCSAIGIETKYKNFKVIIKLLQDFFFSINDNGRNIVGVSELKIGSSIHSLNSLFGAKSIGIKNIKILTDYQNHNNEIKSDIFVNENLVDKYRKSLSIPVRELILKIKYSIN